MERTQTACCWNCKFSSFDTNTEKYICNKFVVYLNRFDIATPNHCSEFKESKTTKV